MSVMSEILGSMTTQEIYDKVVAFLIKQGKPAENEYNCFLWDVGTGHKCAVGCLIPPGEYDPNWEGEPLWCLLTRWGIDYDTPEWYDKAHLLKELMTVHDCKDPETWVQWFKRIAQEFKLSSAVIEESEAANA